MAEKRSPEADDGNAAGGGEATEMGARITEHPVDIEANINVWNSKWSPFKKYSFNTHESNYNEE